jgi:Pyruvate/2-oxoacid:ferredoxin oxidoreductase delta subunit/flavodoxin
MFVHLRYFSGTGNTARAMVIATEELAAAGHRVDCREFNEAPPPETGHPDLLVLGFPVLGFSAPSPFTRFVRRLPPSAGTPAVIFAIGGATVVGGAVLPGYSGSARGGVARLLRRRGYRVTGSYDFSYPENWTQVSNPPDPRATRDILLREDPLVRSAAREIAAGEPRVRENNLFARMLCACVAVLFRVVGRRFLGKLFVSDRTCTGCGQCARTCPAGSISIREGRPAWDLRCAGCNRCINTCPKASIQTSLARLVLHGVLNIGVFVAAIVFARAPLRGLGILDSAGSFVPAAGMGVLPAVLGVVCAILSALVMFFLASAIELGPLEVLFRAVEKTSGGARFFSHSWTRRYRRYRAPDFVPRSIAGRAG